MRITIVLVYTPGISDFTLFSFMCLALYNLFHVPCLSSPEHVLSYLWLSMSQLNTIPSVISFSIFLQTIGVDLSTLLLLVCL